MRVCSVVVLVVSTDAFAPGGFTHRIRSAGQYYTTSDNNLWEPLPPPESTPLTFSEQNQRVKENASVSHQMEILGFQRKENHEVNGHQGKNGFHFEKNDLHTESNGFHEEKNGFHEEKNGFHEEKNGLHVEKNGPHAEKNGFHLEKNGFHLEKNGFHAEKNGSVQEVSQHIEKVEEMLEKNGLILEKNGKQATSGAIVPLNKRGDDNSMKKWESTEATVPYVNGFLLPPAGGLEMHKVSIVSNGLEKTKSAKDVEVESSKVNKAVTESLAETPKSNASTASTSALKIYETTRASVRNGIPKVEVMDKNGFSKTKLQPKEKKGFAKPKTQLNQRNTVTNRSLQVEKNGFQKPKAQQGKMNGVSGKKNTFGSTSKSQTVKKTAAGTSRSQTIKKKEPPVPKRSINVASAPLFFANPLETWTEVAASRSIELKKQGAPKKQAGPWTYFLGSDKSKDVVRPMDKQSGRVSRSQTVASNGIGDTISNILDWLAPKPKKTEAELEAEQAALLAERSRQADESLISLEILPAVSPTTIQGAAAAAAMTALVTGGGLLAIGTAGVVAAGVSITRGSVGETARTIGDWVFEVSTVVAQTLEDKKLPEHFTSDPEKFVMDAVELTLKLFQLSWVVAETATVTSIKWYSELEERQIRVTAKRRAELAARALLSARLQLEARERESRIADAVRRQHEEALQQERERRATEARKRDSMNANKRRELMEERFRLEARDRATRSKARRDAAAQQLFTARVEMETRDRARRIAEEEARLEAERQRLEEERWAEFRRREEERIAELRRQEEERIAEQRRREEARLAEAARKAEEERAAKEAELQKLLRKTEENSVNLLKKKLRQRTVKSPSPVVTGSSIILRSKSTTEKEDSELRAVASRLNRNGRNSTAQNEVEEWRTKSQLTEFAGVLARAKKSRKDGRKGRAVGKKNAIQRLALFLLLSSSSLVSRKSDGHEEDAEAVM